MRIHPKWTDEAYWLEIAIRVQTLRMAAVMGSHRHRALRRREDEA